MKKTTYSQIQHFIFVGTLSLQPTKVYVGDNIEVSGVGFKAGEQVKVKVSNVEVVVKADNDGSFKATLKVPALAGGKQVLVVEGGSRKVEEWFEVKARVSEVTVLIPLTPPGPLLKR